MTGAWYCLTLCRSSRKPTRRPSFDAQMALAAEVGRDAGHVESLGGIVAVAADVVQPEEDLGEGLEAGVQLVEGRRRRA